MQQTHSYQIPSQKFRRMQWHPTPVLLPGESQGWGSLVGCRPLGRTELDTTEATQQQQQLEIQWKTNMHHLYFIFLTFLQSYYKQKQGSVWFDEMARPGIFISGWLIYLLKIGHNVFIYLVMTSEKTVFHFGLFTSKRMFPFPFTEEIIHLDFHKSVIVQFEILQGHDSKLLKHSLMFLFSIDSTRLYAIRYI